jgi:PleD family two-component response regulator
VLSISLINATSGGAVFPRREHIGKAGLIKMMPRRSFIPFAVTRLLESSGLFVMSNLYSKILAARNALTALIIDRDERRRNTALALQQAGFRNVEAVESATGLRYLRDSVPRIVIIGEDMPPVDNLELLTALRGISDVPIMVMGTGNRGDLIHALIRGADVYLERTVSTRVLLARVHAVLRRYDLSRGPEI